jgi:hypothetical protein
MTATSSPIALPPLPRPGIRGDLITSRSVAAPRLLVLQVDPAPPGEQARSSEALPVFDLAAKDQIENGAFGLLF